MPKHTGNRQVQTRARVMKRRRTMDPTDYLSKFGEVTKKTKGTTMPQSYKTHAVELDLTTLSAKKSPGGIKGTIGALAKKAAGNNLHGPTPGAGMVPKKSKKRKRSMRYAAQGSILGAVELSSKTLKSLGK